MNVHDYLRVLRRGWWVLALLAVLGAAVGAGLAAIATPSYQANATVYVSTVGTGSATDLQQGNAFSIQRIDTYANLATTSSVLERAQSQLRDVDIDELRKSVAAKARPETALIDVGGSSADPDRAAELANAVAAALAVEVERLDVPSGSTSPIQVNLVEPAQVPLTAVTPQPRLNVIIGLLVGLVVGLGIIVIRNALDTRIRKTADVPRVPGLETVTAIPATRGGELAREARLESARTLRANLLFGSRAQGAIAMASVTSAGDTMRVARELGRAFGEIGARVVVVDANLTPTPSIKGRPVGPDSGTTYGLADVLTGRVSLTEALVAGDDVNVSVLPAGRVDPISPQLLSTTAMSSVLSQLKETFSFVLIACPPLIERSESAVMAALADSALVVVGAKGTTRAQFLFSLELLAGVRVKTFNVAVSDVRDLELSVSSERAKA